MIGPQTPSDSFAENILLTFREMGHETEALGPIYPRWSSPTAAFAFGILRKPRAIDHRIQQRIVRRIRHLKLDLVVSVEADLWPEVVDDIRRAGTRIALWFPDAVSNLGRMLAIRASFDALFFKEPFLVDRVREVLGRPAHYLPQCCNPHWHHPRFGSGSEPSIAVVGNYYPWRVSLLERLAHAGLPLALYGSAIPRWLHSEEVRRMHRGAYVTREQKAKIFRESAAVLNMLHPAEFRGMNKRLFEAAGSGAATVCEFRDELPNLFELDSEVVGVRSFDELVDSLRHLLNDSARSRSIGDAAARRAHGEHTYKHRLENMLEVLGA